MKIVRLFISLTMTILIVGSAYSYLQVNKDASTKIQSLLEKSAGMVGDPTRGEYVATMSGCIACHTKHADKGVTLAGGVPIKTPFGTFYSPNITSDATAGIGQWTTEEFLTAMSVGLSPESEHYFPAFPYTAYSVMLAQDLVDLKAWLDTVEPVATKAPEHDLAWPFSARAGLFFWKALYFDPLRTIDPIDRGSYLVNGPGHCAECHAPRNLWGGLTKRALTGNARGPEGESVPGITSEHLSKWSIEDLELFLEVGITLSGDFTGGHMTDVIEYGTAQLSGQDRRSISHYLLSEANNP